jgi:Flp pilus assembly protein TadG
MQRCNPRRGPEEGATAVEAAICLFLLLLLIFGIMQFAIALYSWNTMQLAVQQAGRYVMVNNATATTTTAEDQMKSVLTTAAVCTTPTAGQICVNATTAAGTPSTMTLTAKYRFNLTALLAGPFTMTAQATFPLD